jgi:amino acid adenylation domain-containing protein
MSDRVTKLPPEQEAIRARCIHPTGAFVEFPRVELAQSVPQRFEKIVRLYPDRLAVATNVARLTFDGLNKAANRVAHALLDKLGERVEPVVLLAQQDAGTIISFLGILKAGKILVAVDPASPAERITRVLDDTEARVFLAGSNDFAMAAAFATSARQVVNCGLLAQALSDENLDLPLLPDAPAEIRYTSGSTGEPEGIVRSHRRLLHAAMQTINASHISPEDRLLILRTLSFGSRDILRGLLSGAALVLYDIKRDGLSHLAKVVLEQSITYYSSVPTTFRSFMSELELDEKFPSVRVIRLGGEALARREVQAFKTHFSQDCILIHRLSCGEAGNICQYFVDHATEVATPIVPAGFPIGDKEVFLFDENRRRVTVGEIGEIVVRSRYLSSEYWRKPDLTTAKFLPDPNGGDERMYITGDLGRFLPDGCLVYLGRKDLSVKIRGAKVAVSEVEMTLLEHPQVKDGAVVAWERETGESYLAAYVVPHKEGPPDSRVLSEYLKNKLPDYMIPSRFLFLESLPTVNGKLNRRALPRPEQKRPHIDTSFVAPRTQIQEKLASIWSELLHLDQVGIYDNYFELGGHSLLAAQLLARIEKAFGRHLPMASLFRTPTIAELALLLEQTEVPKASLLIPYETKGTRPPFFSVHFGDKKMLPYYPADLDRPWYGLYMSSIDGRRDPDSIEEMAADYIQHMQTVQPHGPYYLGGYCFGALLAFEMAQQLHRQGQETRLLALVDPLAPHPELVRKGRGLRGSLRQYRRRFMEHVKNQIAKLSLGCGRPIPHFCRKGYREVVQRRARRIYLPKEYRGRISLLLTPEKSSEIIEQWRALAGGGLASYEVPGNHDNVFYTENIPAFVKQLTHCLRHGCEHEPMVR